MKTLVILVVALFAYAQATSEPISVQQKAANALKTCAQERDYDEDKIINIFKKDILPESTEFADFFVCYWKNLLVIKDDGSFDHLHIKVSYPYLIRDKYPSISEADSNKIAEDAVAHCKDASQADSIGLTGIKYRNCLMQYVKDSQE